ncbi:MAG: hypothetical protein VR64_04500 [Desulfatitalea sp. BRH_c12]|nr:MAG: hypothetical protein VR64_04500 [Desulfatitalea sp. BRH_c12]
MNATFHKPHLNANRSVPVGERRLSFFILSVLGIIALSIIALQTRFDPSTWRAQPADEIQPQPGAAVTQGLDASPVSGLQALSPPEAYDAASLSDKINGKAELYLSAGFERLENRRFRLSDHPEHWLEQFVYTMDDHASAFSVYSQQRRANARTLDLTVDAYQAANGIFLVQDRHYVEIIGSASSEAIVAKMTDLARAFVQAHPAAAAVKDERALFPETDRVTDSLSLTAANAFGFEPFDQIFSAKYRRGDRTAMAFLSRRASAAQAEELAEAYVAYLIDYGGQPVARPEAAPPFQVIAILDMYEIVFSQGELLGGVHEADDLDLALELAEALYRNASEASDAQ